MSLSSPVSRVDYTANGSQSVYTFPFRIDDEDDLLVTVKDTASPPAYTTYALTTNYTVSGVGSDSGGSVTLVAGNLTLNYKLTIRRKLTLIQPTDWSSQGPFSGATLEEQLDHVCMRLQQLQDEVNRCVKFKETEVGTVAATEVDDATTRASKAIVFDASGNMSLASAVPAGSVSFSVIGQNIAQAADATAERNLLGATSGKWLTAHITAKNITAALLASDAVSQAFQARLTLLTATPVTVADQSAKTTVYVTPYRGDKIGLYDGTDWTLRTLTEVSAAVPSTTDTMYDVFIYDVAGTLTLDLVAWTNDTTRATALATQNGVLSKTGALTRRYVGSFRTTGVSGNTEDSFAKRYVWNYYNRVPRVMRAVDTTDSWAYTIDTFRQARATATNQVECIVGVAEVPVRVQVRGIFENSGAGVRATVGIGFDSTSVNSAGITIMGEAAAATEFVSTSAEYNAYPAVGQHEFVWLEKSVATGTTTWMGDLGLAAGSMQTGIMGEVMG